jgi:uncharacterized protein YjiS (DUF1127 family)
MTTYTGNCSRSLAGESVGVLDTLLEKFCIWMNNQLLRVRIQQERRQLLSMSEAMLKDLGISRAAAEREAQRTDLPLTRSTSR